MKTDMSELGRFHHYVENALLKAVVRLESGNTNGADEIRIDLIGQLEKIEKGNLIIEQYISKLGTREWSKKENLDEFEREYREQFSGLKVILSLHD